MIPVLRPHLASGVAALLLVLPGCYQGEWRTGVEVPVASKKRLLPTRDVERWEVEPTVTPYVLRVRAEIAPRCRNGLFGESTRTDVGTFRRTGGTYWKAAAVTTGILGGASALIGGTGWISRDLGTYARPSMYAVGGLLSVGGIVNCILSIKKGSTARYALCGSLLGAGAAVLVGAGLSQIEVTRDVVDPMNPMSMPMPVREPLIGTNVFQGMVYGGAAGLGIALGSGIASAVWRGEVQRTKVVTTPNASLWERQGGEALCGPSKPLTGRTATLEVTTERLSEGPGSEADPIRVRVAIGDEGKVALDLRPLRQALGECGVLRVQLNPDTLYEQFNEEYVPSSQPQLSLPTAPAGRPIHGQIHPREGVTLSGIEGRKRPGRVSVPGFSEEALLSIDRHCKTEARAAIAAPSRVEGPAIFPRPEEPERPIGPPSPEESTEAGRVPELSESMPTVGPGECSPSKRDAILRECELSCGKALQIGTCVFERRKCLIDARYSQQKNRDQDLCELTWEKCLFKAGIGPGSWGRCVDGCQKKELSLCQP